MLNMDLSTLWDQKHARFLYGGILAPYTQMKIKAFSWISKVEIQPM